MKKLLLIAAVGIVLLGCQKEHTKYRFTPKYTIGEQVQFEKSIEHDNAAPGTHIYDIPQPMTITGFYYDATWRDNWYYVTLPDGTIYGSSIDELSLQKWNGTLQK